METITKNKDIQWGEGDYVSKCGQYRLTIKHDEISESPREWDNATVIACFTRRYAIGDRNHGIVADNYADWGEMKEAITSDFETLAILPVYMYSHGGVTINTTGYNCRWDSAQIGWAFIPKNSDAGHFQGWGKERLHKVIRDEVEEYAKYLRGEVYSYAVYQWENEEWIPFGSCFGFLGGDHYESALLEDCGLPTHVIETLKEKK